MNVKEVFRNLATNHYMPEFDYVDYKFSFKTVFYISDFAYCLCTCGYEHEYVTYISESGKIDENSFAKIEQCILAGKCPHVNNAPHDCIKEASIYGINIAAALGTQNVFTNRDNRNRYFGRLHSNKSSLFRLGPFETAIIRNPMFATMPFVKDFTEVDFPVTYMSAHRPNKNQQSITFESSSGLETCLRIGKKELLNHCFKFYMFRQHPVAVFEYTCKHNLKEVQKLLLKQPYTDYERFHYLAKACEFAIIYNKPKVLNKLLKKLPRSFEEENKLKRKISKLVFILNRTNCLVVLKKYDFPQLSYVPVASCVKILIKLLDIGNIREEVIQIFKTIPYSRVILTSVRSNYTGTVLHYYICNCINEKLAKHFHQEYALRNQDPDYCYVFKTLIDLDPDQINREDSFRMTPLAYLLYRSKDCSPIKRQGVEVILFENPDIKADVPAERSLMTLALKLDIHMAKAEKSDEVIPVLNGSFVPDGQRYGRFGYNYHGDFALNFFVPLLVESGFPVSKEFMNNLIFKIKPLPLPLQDYILKHLSTPRSLKLCCRDTLRKAYKGRQIHSFVTMTEMPKALKDYILLKPLLKSIP